MEFILGFFGAVCAMGCFFAGAVTGRRSRTAAAPPMTEAEARQVRDQQQAFQRLQNYTVEDAYGLNRG